MGAERPPPPDPERDADSPLTNLVAEFERLAESGRTPELEQYLASVPEPLREEARRRIESLLRMHAAFAALPRRAADSGEHDPLLGRVFGDFEIVRRIGAGGMGVVYLARQKQLERRVAVKVLAADAAQRRGRIARFEREASAPARHEHPGVVRILASGTEHDHHWYAMEFVDGSSLDQILKSVRQQAAAGATRLTFGGKSWFTAATEILALVADALDHVHRNGIVHRDVKPQNLLLDRRGSPRLIDFGVASEVDGEDITLTGDVVGSPHYMSPEQVLAKRVLIDHRTDIYSLGVVLYEALTLRRPFEGQTHQQVMFAISFKEPQRPRRINRRIPTDLETVCMVAMEKDPDHRYQTAEALARDLRHVLNHEAIEAKRPPLARTILRAARHHRAAILAFLLGALLLTGAMEWRAHRARVAELPAISVTVREGPSAAPVFARPIAMDTGLVGEARPLGNAPLVGARLEPGYWRIEVGSNETGFCEMTRLLESRTDTPLDAWIRTPRDVTADMVRIDVKHARVGMDDPTDPVMNLRPVSLPPYWIDVALVSNSQFREYVLATRPTQLPVFWPLDPPACFPEEWSDQPVVGIAWLDAIRYAEWRGKRLPTMEEWEVAARGPDASLFPWGKEPEPLAELFPPPLRSTAFDPDPSHMAWTALHATLKPVGVCDPRAISRPFGLKHAMGNVQQWTESVWRAFANQIVTFDPNLRYVKGATLEDLAGEARAFGLSVCFPQSAVIRALRSGFRCARSDRP